MPVTREPALVDDGIPGGPGVYSTRCPPLPRLRLHESREVVRRAALRAKGVDPDLVERCVTPSAKSKHERSASADSTNDSPCGAAGKPSPRDRDPLADLVDGADALFDLPEGRKRDRGGGGGGDFSVGARADHHLRTLHDVRKVRAEQNALRTLLPKGGRGAKASPGAKAGGNAINGDPATPKPKYTSRTRRAGSVTSRGEDRVAEEERKRIERELTAAKSSLRRREMAHNAAVNARVGRERELATLRGTLEVVTKENDRANDLSGPKAKVEAAKTEVAKKLEHAQSESDVSDRYDHIAARLIAANVELKRGTAALKADLADATADAASCEEYEREAMDARRRGHDALEWVRARYLERVNAWKRDVEHAKVERDKLLDDLKDEKTRERILARRREREQMKSEADIDVTRRVTKSLWEELERKETEEEWCRAALQRLASAAGLNEASSLNPAQILAQLEKSRETRCVVDDQIAEVQARERAMWSELLARTEELRTARLGIGLEADDDDGAYSRGRVSAARASFAAVSNRAEHALEQIRARRATLLPLPPTKGRSPSIDSTPVSSGDSPLRSRRSSSKPPVPKMSRMRAASISAATMFSPPSRRSFAQTPAQTPARTPAKTPAKTPAPSVTRVSVSVIGSRRDERLERSIATREKELNVKMRAFTRITSHLATMDEGLKAVDDMVTRVVRVPKRADQRVGYGQTVSSRSSESLHAPGGNGKAGVNSSRMSAPMFASTARAKERERRRNESHSASHSPTLALSSLEEEEEELRSYAREVDAGGGPPRRASDLWSAVRRVIPEDTPEDVIDEDGNDGGGGGVSHSGKVDAAVDKVRRSDSILARYERLPGRLDALLKRITGVMRALPTGRGRRPTVVLGAKSFANGGRGEFLFIFMWAISLTSCFSFAGIGPQHFLAGVGHRVGKVHATVDEVDDDPARMRLKRGRAYREMAMTWCFRAGRPINPDDDDDDVLVTGDDGLLHFGTFILQVILLVCVWAI